MNNRLVRHIVDSTTENPKQVIFTLLVLAGGLVLLYLAIEGYDVSAIANAQAGLPHP